MSKYSVLLSPQKPFFPEKEEKETPTYISSASANVAAVIIYFEETWWRWSSEENGKFEVVLEKEEETASREGGKMEKTAAAAGRYGNRWKASLINSMIIVPPLKTIELNTSEFLPNTFLSNLQQLHHSSREPYYKPVARTLLLTKGKNTKNQII